MTPKRIFQFIALLAILAMSFASTGGALAGGSNCDPYVAAKTGDTWSSIADMCGVTVQALQAANAAVGPTLYVGQVLFIPSGTASSTSVATVFPTATATATPAASSRFGNLMVTYGHGLLVRTGPDISNSEIKSPFVSAVKFSHWVYRKDSVTTDSIGFVWVEVNLSPLVTGNSTGWILVRDSLGKYFTTPNIGPKITLDDP